MYQNHGLLKNEKSTNTNKPDYDYDISVQILKYKEILNLISPFFFKWKKKDRTVHLMMTGNFQLILKLTEEI